MSTNQERAGDWIRESTPNDSDWNDDSEYGIAVNEWDDYSADQADPTPAPPQPQTEEEAEAEEIVEPVDEASAEESPLQEPQAEEAQVEEAEPWAEPEEQPADEQQDEPAEAVAEVNDEAEYAEEEPVAPAEPIVEEAPVEEAPVEEEPDPARAELTEDEPAEDDEDEHPRPAARAAWGESSSETDEAPAEPEEPARALRGSDFGRPISAPIMESPVEPEPEAADITQELPELEAGMPETAAPLGSNELDGIFRDADADGAPVAALAEAAETTAVIDPEIQRRLEEERIEEERRAMELAALREERNARLGVVSTSPENASRPIQPRQKLVTDKFLGSFGLFALRLVVAGIVGVVGYQILTDIDTTAAFIGKTLIPEPRLSAWIAGFALGAIAVLLVLGMLVRVAGFLLLLLSAGSLAFIRWGAFNVFVPGLEGFLGDKDLLMAAVGLLFLTLGGGRWGIDGAFRRARDKAREAKQA